MRDTQSLCGNVPVGCAGGAFSAATVRDSLGRAYSGYGNGGEKTDLSYVS